LVSGFERLPVVFEGLREQLLCECTDVVDQRIVAMKEEPFSSTLLVVV